MNFATSYRYEAGVGELVVSPSGEVSGDVTLRMQRRSSIGGLPRNGAVLLIAIG